MTPGTTAVRRYAVAGTGQRAQMYVEAMLGDHAEVAELVAWCEPNPGRTDYYDEIVVGRRARRPVPRYEPAQLEAMIREHAVDVVVVTAPDHAHADLVVPGADAPAPTSSSRSR